ncbi:invasion associated locus B family protein [Sneathiella marina]|uniref:Invasion associated locus B family protein n=1 Tax=Sneathiella marina TaxID=2950108 RepID=A0ABY4W4K1_9PROT|nr:invasion associated locus B family protein [Sneathiella marina]USG61968.1 invasion associated locus B family protein [Sneathiella marina]
MDVKLACRVLIIGALLLVVSSRVGITQAQTTTAEAPMPAESPWSVHCEAISREALPDCRIEQRAVVTKTGRLLLQVTLQVPADTREPVLMIQGPLGTFLPAGIGLDVDGAELIELPFQTCEANGCFAATPMTADQLEALFGGQKLNVQLQSVNRQPITVPMSLIGFTSAYRKIQ